MTKPSNAARTAATTAAAAQTPATTSAATTTPEPVVDPFADLPVITIGEATGIQDLSGLETSPEYKYAKVAGEARADKLPVQKGWKHASAMFVAGTNKGGENGFKPGSVMGTVADIVKRAGRGGIPAYELCAELRKRQIGNKRSKYCTKLPPVGWAEGYCNGALSRSIIGVHASKRAPLLVVPVAETGTDATAAQNSAALTDQSGGTQVAKAA